MFCNIGFNQRLLHRWSIFSIQLDSNNFRSFRLPLIGGPALLAKAYEPSILSQAPKLSQAELTSLASYTSNIIWAGFTIQSTPIILGLPFPSKLIKLSPTFSRPPFSWPHYYKPILFHLHIFNTSYFTTSFLRFHLYQAFSQLISNIFTSKYFQVIYNIIKI